MTAVAKQGQQFTTSFQKNTKKLSPVTFVDGQTKDFLKRKLHENQLLIWRSCVEGSIYVALFHEIKRFLKKKTSKHRQGKQLAFWRICDMLLQLLQHRHISLVIVCVCNFACVTSLGAVIV